MNKKQKQQLLTRRIALIIVDMVAVLFSVYGALWLTGSVNTIARYDEIGIYVLCVQIVVSLIIFAIFKLYHSIWEFASVSELFKIIIASFISGIMYCIITYLMAVEISLSNFVVYSMILTLLVGATRYSYRGIRSIKARLASNQKELERVMIVGAGSAGEKLYREIKNTPKIHKQVVCFIDDDASKHNCNIHDVLIAGGRNTIHENVEKYRVDEIYVALPSVDHNTQKELLKICQETKCKVKKLPGMYQLINGERILSQLKNVEIQDLLGREAIVIDSKGISAYVKDKVVMVTGGGGSIGSELCRQIAAKQPKTLVIVDIYENNAYDIQMELKRAYPYLDLQVMIASVRDENKMNSLFEKYHPNIVFHAAAHKHVPLMEDSPHEAIKNNVFGTYNVANACHKYGVERMILISTDKAVNPTNIMGASKRLCEMIIQAFASKSECDFVSVRFGNVLGSNGSVIPLFKKQIEQGGPVTVTHPEIIRYFMTIPEAVSLVLQAGAYAQGGEIFILDMGEPVKIVDMARNLIRLSGYDPDVDIKISFTGLRPGEKLYEEKLMKEEGLRKTDNQLIHIANPIEMDYEQFFKDLDQLYTFAYDEQSDIRSLVKKLVPTYIEKK